MPSIAHDAPVELLRRNPTLAVALLCGVRDLDLPDHVTATLGCTDLTNVVPAQFLADMVIAVTSESGGKPVLAIVVESQLRSDEEKVFSWPVYLTTARRLYKCLATLLVIAPDPAEAEACRKVIRTGHPGFDLEPIVIDPASTPDPAKAGLPAVEPELTVFAACMGAVDLECEAGQHQVLDALRGLDTEQRRAYQTLILAVASDAARHALEAMMATPAYKSDFVDALIERGLEQGLEQGLAQKQVEDLLKLLAARGIHLTRKHHDEVDACRDLGKLERWFDRALTATAAEEVFRP